MAARSFPTWIITQEPGMVPNRKGPFHDDKYVEELLRDAYRSNPEIVCIVIDNPSETGWSPQHGHEWLDMYGDRRKRHPRKDRSKQPPQTNLELSDRIMRLLEDHDRCPPQARDYSRRRGTAILIMQAIRQANDALAPQPNLPAAYTSQNNLDRLREQLGRNSVMWGEPLPHHEDVPLYLHPAPTENHVRLSGSYVHNVNQLLRAAGVEVNGDILHDCMMRAATEGSADV